jgi:hypothetical protein
MEKGDSPSLIDRIGTPLFLLALGASAAVWFISRAFSLFSNGSSPVVTFDKGSCYLFGASIGLLTLTYMIVREFWLKRPLTNKQSAFFSCIAISGVVLMFVFPHVAHLAADKYFKVYGYSVCEEASHQWLFMRDIVYIDESVECSSDLKKK